MRALPGYAALLIVLVPVLVTAQAPQTYSDVNEVEETGDLVGTELILSFAGEKVAGTLRHYEGTEPAAIAVTGRLDGAALTLSGSYPDGKVQITARFAKNRIVGKLSYHLDGQTNNVELDLPRLERPRMEKAAAELSLLLGRLHPEEASTAALEPPRVQLRTIQAAKLEACANGDGTCQ